MESRIWGPGGQTVRGTTDRIVLVPPPCGRGLGSGVAAAGAAVRGPPQPIRSAADAPIPKKWKRKAPSKRSPRTLQAGGRGARLEGSQARPPGLGTLASPPREGVTGG